MARRSWLSLFIALAVWLALPSSAFAETKAEGVLKDHQAELTSLLKKGKSAENDKKIAAVFDELLDYDSLAKDSLGKYWDDRTDQEKKDFQDLLKRLVRNAYKKNLKKTLKYDVEYKGSDQAKKGVLVKTVAKSKTNAREEPIQIDYAMHEADGKWTVYDFVTEGSSLVHNFRSQFRSVIKKKGFPELMKKMKRKADSEGA
jgi:phospholipid transport system substrate-binding protein